MTSKGIHLHFTQLYHFYEKGILDNQIISQIHKTTTNQERAPRSYQRSTQKHQGRLLVLRIKSHRYLSPIIKSEQD